MSPRKLKPFSALMSQRWWCGSTISSSGSSASSGVRASHSSKAFFVAAQASRCSICFASFADGSGDAAERSGGGGGGGGGSGGGGGGRVFGRDGGHADEGRLSSPKIQTEISFGECIPHCRTTLSYLVRYSPSGLRLDWNLVRNPRRT